jgi:hypothetical protein
LSIVAFGSLLAGGVPARADGLGRSAEPWDSISIDGSVPLPSRQARGSVSETEIQFDIPSQSLATALVAYGRATGLEVFYDGALAVGRRSAAVKGVFTPGLALQMLLRGTGYIPRATADPGTFTIVTPPRETKPLTTMPQAALRRHEPYFARLQARVGERMCGGEEGRPDGEPVIVSLWLGADGVIARADVLASGGSPAHRRAGAALRGLNVGEPPPAGLPQPVTMAIFPPAAGEPVGCSAAKDHYASGITRMGVESRRHD